MLLFIKKGKQNKYVFCGGCGKPSFKNLDTISYQRYHMLGESVFCEFPPVNDKVDRPQKECGADDIAEGNGEQVAGDGGRRKSLRGARNPFRRQPGFDHHSERQEEHIRDTVFKPHRDKGRYRHQKRDKFTGHVERAEGQPDG